MTKVFSFLFINVIFAWTSLSSAQVNSSITLTYPTNDVAIFPGVPITLKWSYTGNALANFYIYKGGAPYRYLGSKSGYTTGIGTFLVVMPTDLPYGNDYQIVATTDPEVLSISPMISCEPYLISVSGITFKKSKMGTAVYLKWTMPVQFKANIYSHIGNYVEILRNGVVVATLYAINTLEYVDGTYATTWWLDKSITPVGSGYTARLISRYNPIYFDVSPEFSIK
ncbi:hypothetical protein [Bdellovibrio sp. HCB-110]|uniref:hypothetical protein n=1 Tax=Bdellovibrio sp. HCB-110 TaxID=3391182 RepID=UPI0039B36C86